MGLRSVTMAALRCKCGFSLGRPSPLMGGALFLPRSFAVLLLFLSSVAVVRSSLQSVPDLENAMYINLDGSPCVRLLNLTGEIGCANPGRTKFGAPVRLFSNESVNPSVKSAFLLPSTSLHQFLQRTLSDPLLAEQVAGVLVEDIQANASRLNSGFSPDMEFPQADFAPYKADYTWNVGGSGVLKGRFDFPVILLSQDSASAVREVAAANERRKYKHPLHVAEFDFIMQTTKSETHDSESCLKDWACLPLGGYSVWSSLSPINISLPSERPILLVVASMDSASFFRNMAIGADSSLSGMIAVLAAVDALSKMADIDQFQKQVVFLVVTGEAWGYLGSRRFLAELADGSLSVAGLNASRIHQILEVGSIGQALNAQEMTLYAHKQGSQIPASVQELLDSLQLSVSSLNAGQGYKKVKLQLADETNPGIPPSSLMSFLQKVCAGVFRSSKVFLQDNAIAGVVLEEFNGAFENPFYHSHYDGADNIDAEALALTASLVARSVYSLGNSAADLTSLQSIVVNDSLVDEMVSCLLARNGSGMTCDLVTSLITPTEKFGNHYVGVLLGSPSANPYVDDVDDTARFVWNFLASRTGAIRSNQSIGGNGSEETSNDVSSVEECTQTCTREDEVCVASTGDHKGHCMLSTTRYVPAYSPRLRYHSSGWQIIPAVPGDTMSEVDPVWTESFWKSFSLRLYLEQSSRQDELILLLGLAVTAGSYAAVAISKTVFWKRLKRA